MRLRAKIFECEFDCEGEAASVWAAFSLWYPVVKRLHTDDEPEATEPTPTTTRETHH